MLNKRAIDLKRRLAAGEFTAGIWIEIASPMVCEIIAGAGLDWVIVDAEHSPFNPETLHHILMAFKGSDTVPIIRVPWNDHVMIKQVLDLGFDGILVPQTNTAEAARSAVEACRYPPMGRRGFGPMRASNYGRDQDEYTKLANDLVFCVIQIEDVRAVDQIDGIVSTPGIDGIFVGRCDMSGTTDRFLDTDSSEVWNAVESIFATATEAGIPVGGALFGVENIEKNLQKKWQLIEIGEAHAFIKDGIADALGAFDQAVSRTKQ